MAKNPRAHGETSYLWSQQQRIRLCQETTAAIEKTLSAELGEAAKASVEIWKTIIGVQMHFNDIEMRIRNFAVTIFTAVAGAAGFALKDRLFVGPVPLASALLGTGALSWLMFLFMDRYWYHRLLLGAVYHGAAVEMGLRNVLPAASLSATLKHESPVNVPFTDVAIHSDHKILVFYWTGIAVMLIAALSLLQLEPPSSRASTAASTNADAVARCDILHARVDAAEARRAAASMWLYARGVLSDAGTDHSELDAVAAERAAERSLADAEKALQAANCVAPSASRFPPTAPRRQSD